MCTNIPVPSRIIFNESPRSINRQMNIGTKESEKPTSLINKKLYVCNINYMYKLTKQ